MTLSRTCGCSYRWLQGELLVNGLCEGHRWALTVPQIKVTYRTAVPRDQDFRLSAFASVEPYPGTGLHYGSAHPSDLPVVLRRDGDLWLEQHSL